MIRFVQVPNLPQGKVKAGIISGKNKKIIELLEVYGVSPIFTQTNVNIDNNIASHADINIHHFENNIFLVDSCQKQLIKDLKKLHADILTVQESVYGKYPFDCRLNFARIGNVLIGKSGVCDNHLKEYCEANGIDIINVNQGYCKCSTCIVNESSIITDDPSIKKAADAAGIDSLFISKGDIRLNGYHYGFIGGASTLIDKNKLLFFGNLKAHTDYQNIIRFCHKHDCDIVFDESFELTDVGGMIPVLESDDSK